MNNYRNNERDWRQDDRRENQGQHQSPYRQQGDWQQDQRQEQWPQQQVDFYDNRNRRSHEGGYDYDYRTEWNRDASPYHSSYGDSRHAGPSGYTSGRFGIPNSYSHDNNMYGTRYGRGGSDWGYSGAAPGGFGSSAPLDGDGTIGVSPRYGSGPNGTHGLGYSSMGGLLHRNIPGMNSLGNNNSGSGHGNQGNNW